MCTGVATSFWALSRADAAEGVDAVVAATSSTLVGKVVLLVVVVLLTMLISYLITHAIRRLLNVSSMPSGSIFVNIARGLTWFFALLLVLEPVFGVSPTAFVTALGVTSLVVSLGMQDSISNLVGGVALTAAKVVQPGDVIEVSGTRGEVLDVTLRDTRVRDSFGNVQAIPNSVLNKSALIKLTAREAACARVSFLAKPGADLAKVEREATQAVMHALANELDFSQPPAVSIFFNGMGAQGTNATLSVVVKSREELGSAKDSATRALAQFAWLAGAPDDMGTPSAAGKPSNTGKPEQPDKSDELQEHRSSRQH